MSKTSNFKRFNFKTITGEDVAINCETYEYTGGWGHRACIVYVGNNFINFKKRQTYYNRTRESFDYESVLYKVVSAYFDNKNIAFINAQIEAIAKHESEKAEAWANNFIKKYNSLSDDIKNRIKSSDIILETIEDADNLIKTASMFDALMGGTN